MFKNVRYLWKMLGSTDISGIGDGTATGALSAINSIFGIEAYEYDSAKSYGAKSVVVHNGKFYKSSLTIGASHAPVTGDFDASYWTEISALEFINNLRLAQNVFTDFIVNYSGQEILGSGYDDVNTALKSVYNKTADLETSVSTLNTNLGVKKHTITLPSDWTGSCILLESGSIGAIVFNAYCTNVLNDNSKYPLFSVSKYGFKYGTIGIFRNNGANTTTIFAYLSDGTFYFEPHGGSAEANNYVKGTLVMFKS